MFQPCGHIVHDLARSHQDALLEEALREREGRSASGAGERPTPREESRSALQALLLSVREATARIRFRPPVL